MTRRYLTALMIALAAVGSAGCKTTSPLAGPIDSMLGKRAESEARLSTAAAAAIAEGRTAEALAHYEALYNRQMTHDAETTLNYAQLLRKSGRAAQALDILKPLALDKTGQVRGDAPAAVRADYAACLIAQGKFADAEKILNGVLEDQKAASFHKDAYNLMGVALDARGERREAEQMFRQALDGWRGDSSSVLNNLGLNLAGQGRFDESLLHLRRALAMAPGREELARNVALVSDLRDKVLRQPPKKQAAPIKKNPVKKKT